MESNNKEEKNIVHLKDIDVDLSELSEMEINDLKGYIYGRKLLNRIKSPILDKGGNEIDLLDRLQVVKAINDEINDKKRIVIVRRALQSSESKLRQLRRHKAGENEIFRIQSNIAFWEAVIEEYKIDLENITDIKTEKFNIIIEDFSKIKYNGKEYDLTPNQREIIKYLCENKDKNGIHKDTLKQKIELSKTTELRNSFRSRNSELWQTLICTRNGNVYLELE